ncbi:hypothetical protein EBS80_04185 [bacterium]|nr:hypothetical protein [bacterium]
MEKSLEFLLSSLVKAQALANEKPEGDLIAVSETVSAAASVYETLRNSLEYDEEHLLRRNAIRRILKRRLGEVEGNALASDLLKELIWARYLPNKTVPESMIATIASVIQKYQSLFAAADQGTKDGAHAHEWLLDVASTEVEYVIAPPIADEALASFAYSQLKARLSWASAVIAEDDRDLQLYVAVHRAVLKSNLATLRFRVLTLFESGWTKATAGDETVVRVQKTIVASIAQVERQIRHPGQDALYNLVRRHAVVFQVIRDVAEADPHAFGKTVAAHDTHGLDGQIASAASARYDRFRRRLRNSVIRAVSFLFVTKMILALLIEAPYERLVIKTTNWTPLLVNILFHPTLLGIIGLSARLPETANTDAIIREAHAFLGLGEEVGFTYKLRRPWSRGALGAVFNVIYAVMFLFTITVIATILRALDFNGMSIVFFVFFLSLVTFFGLKIRNSRRELMVVEAHVGIVGTVADILFLPMIRAGRWVALRAPRVNVFLFFFDFIVEAPFKAAINLIEGWLAFLREKKEEI